MANNNTCGCSAHRNSNSGYGCLNNLGRRCRWENYPYYAGPCPNTDGEYDCDEDGEENGARGRRRRNRPCYGMFMAMAPTAVAPNGIIPLVGCNGLYYDEKLAVNGGMITIEEGGTYLASYTVRVPEGAEVDSTITLNVNDASQSSAIANVGGGAPNSFTAQAIFEACDRSTVTLRSSDAINVTDTSAQPLFTLSLVRLD